MTNWPGQRHKVYWRRYEGSRESLGNRGGVESNIYILFCILICDIFGRSFFMRHQIKFRVEADSAISPTFFSLLRSFFCIFV